MKDDTYWARAAEIFDAIVDFDDVSRAGLLETLCANEPGLRADVEELLDTDARVAEGLVPEAATVQDAEARHEEGALLGSVIGPFRLLDVLGTGGMGTVYRAERLDAEFTQRVAIKILSRPVSDSAVARRFRSERRILASLAHPHIVTLLDGGVATSGRPYLVMEHVDGVPITRYCADARLHLSERLHLFRQVCSAVHYAHRHSVIHRDLKPANILVTTEGVPKVLDFGVAKLLHDAPVAGEPPTSVGLGPLTPNYASPEQLRGLPTTSSSDVYALGVLLYELLTGTRPYETEGKPLDEVIRLVVDAEPPRPSSRQTPNDGLPYRVASAIKGDLDAIVRRAMAKQPESRYGSAEELAEDIGRFLRGVPVVAQEPSLAYLTRKVVSRHKPVVVAVAVSLLLVIVALVAAVWQARIASAAQQRAEARFAEVRQLANALIFDIHDAVAPLPGSTPVRQMIVTRALGYLERLAVEAAGDETLQIELAAAYTQIGRVQGHPGSANLGDRDGAIASFRRAQALVDSFAHRADAPALAVVRFVDATRRLSETLTSVAGRRGEGVEEARKGVAVADAHYRRAPGDVRARNLLASSSFTAAIAEGFPNWLPHWLRVSALYESLLADAPDDPENLRNVALVEKYLGTHYQASKDLDQALAHYNRARQMDEKRLVHAKQPRQVQTDVAIDLSNEAGVLEARGDASGALRLFEASLALRQEVADTDPKDESAQARLAYAHSRLARAYELTAPPRAIDHARTALAILARLRNVTEDRSLRSYVGETTFTLARLERAAGRNAEACSAYARAFVTYEGLSAADRGMGMPDPLPDVATHASACGLADAKTWLATGKVP